MIPSLIIVAVLVILLVAWTVSRRRGRAERGTAAGVARRAEPPLEAPDRESLLADPRDEQAAAEESAARVRDEPDRSVRGDT